MGKLVEGKIPANTVCPYREQCPEPKRGTCGHLGTEHNVPYSCGYARLFKIMGKKN